MTFMSGSKRMSSWTRAALTISARRRPRLSWFDKARHGPSGQVRHPCHDRMDQVHVVLVSHPYRFDMCACVEDDLGVFLQGLIDIDRHVVQVAEGRLRTQLALGESAGELILARQGDIPGSHELLQGIEVDMPR